MLTFPKPVALVKITAKLAEYFSYCERNPGANLLGETPKDAEREVVETIQKHGRIDHGEAR